MITHENLLAEYLDYINNYLTIDLFAEHRGLYISQAKVLLELAEQVYNTPHPEA